VSALLDSNPEYQAVTIMLVDWDTFKNAPIISELGIPRRSTLVMFNEGEEVARVIAQTAEPAIAELFDAVI
jgi:hypothetical protein